MHWTSGLPVANGVEQLDESDVSLVEHAEASLLTTESANEGFHSESTSLTQENAKCEARNHLQMPQLPQHMNLVSSFFGYIVF
jgi:hypothetical protein